MCAVVTTYCVYLHSLDGNEISDPGCIKLCNALQECQNLQRLQWVWSHLRLIIPQHTQCGIIMLHNNYCVYIHVTTVWMLWGSILFLILNLHRLSDSLTCQTKLYCWVDKMRVKSPLNVWQMCTLLSITASTEKSWHTNYYMISVFLPALIWKDALSWWETGHFLQLPIMAPFILCEF